MIQLMIAGLVLLALAVHAQADAPKGQFSHQGGYWIQAIAPTVADGVKIGDSWYDTTAAAFKVCAAVDATTCSTWSTLGAGGAPTGATYVTQSADATLTAEQSLGLLTTGLTLNTVTAGTGVLSAYGGASCTNQFPRSLNASGAAVCASVATGDVTDNAITYAKLQDVTATSRFLGRITAGAGDAEELTGTQATTLLDAVTSALKGLAPASGGGTTNFLRADATWAAPPGGGNHTILSATHTDTTAATVVRGDLMTGQGVTPTWSRLALGTAGRYPRSDGTDLGFSAVAAAGAGSCTNQFPRTLTDNAAPTCADVAAADFAVQVANRVLAGPTSGADADPTFRLLVADDIPSLDTAKLTTGTMATARLGSGTADSTTFLRGDQTWAVPAGGANHNLLSTTHPDTLAASPVLGDLTHGNATPAWARLAGNITTAKQFLTQTGTGAVSAVPVWGTIVDADVPNTITLDNLTQVTTRAIADTTGTLAVGRGGTNLTASADDNVMVGNGTTWETKAVPSCSGGTDALTYTIATNAFGCNTITATGAGLTRINGASGAAGADLTWQRLSANCAANATTTLAICMTTTGVGAGTWRFRYAVIYQAAATTTGVDFAVNHTGTVTRFVASSWFATSGGSAATALGDQVGSNTASLAEAKSARAINTKFGSTLGVDTASADMLVIIEGTVIVSVSGSLELKHASELAASTQVMADTVLELHKIN